MSDLLNARDIAFAYGTTDVLNGVNLTLAAGEVVALVGPNGSGKSTLIKSLLGQLRARGRIAWEGRELHRWRRRDLARSVAYLAQSPVWEPDQPVADVLRMGRAPYWGAFGIESHEDMRVIEQVVAMLDLMPLLSRRMDEISGGQRQRIFLGRALAQEPRAMLLDEPNTFLDLRHQAEMLQILRRLAKEEGIGILMASHDLNLAGAFADQMLLLRAGEVVAAGIPEQVLNARLLSEVYGIEMERIDRAGRTPLVFPRMG